MGYSSWVAAIQETAPPGEPSGNRAGSLASARQVDSGRGGCQRKVAEVGCLPLLGAKGNSSAVLFEELQSMSQFSTDLLHLFLDAPRSPK